MISFKMINLPLKKGVLIVVSIITSGLFWYLSNGLTGDYWFLLWLAPIPIISLALKSTGKQTFLIAFIAYLIGRISWFSYLVDVATIVPAIIFTLIIPLVFAFIIVLARVAVLKSNSWLSAFAFPVFYTIFEYLLMTFSSDGTASSIAYSQTNFLLIIQIVSITGILGITFLVTFFPSVIVICWFSRNQKRKFHKILLSASAIFVSVIIFGLIRLNHEPEKGNFKAGLVVLDEKLHDISGKPDFARDTTRIKLYTTEISKLAKHSVEIVVLPERAININKETERAIFKTLCSTAIQNKVFIIAGYTNYRNQQLFNSSVVIDDNGNVVADYNKKYLVTGLERQFGQGNKIGLFNFKGLQAGTAICKDLDFPEYIRKYTQSNIVLLTIPAWDFVVDDWLHSHMSVMRSVENGFSQIRTARQGRLSIVDCFGRVLSETSCSSGQKATLTGMFPIFKISTFYSHFGNWFGILCLMAGFYFVTIMIRNRILKIRDDKNSIKQQKIK
jgi:apolipoprotein N-acyltransferase